MKPHPRIRKAIKWGGAAMAVLLAGLLVWMIWWSYPAYLGRGFGGGIGNGVIGVAWFDEATRKLMDAPYPVALRFGAFEWVARFRVREYGWSITLPLWMPLLLCLTSSAIAWRLDSLAKRRALIGACPKCFYNRAGLAPAAVCPECGAAAPVAGIAAPRG